MSGKIVAGARKPAASVSSRLVRSPSGRTVAVVITMPLPDLEAGYRFRVLGNEIKDRGFGFTGAPTGRPPLPDETAGPAVAWGLGSGRRERGRTRTGRRHAGYRARGYRSRRLRSASAATGRTGARSLWLRAADATSTPQRPKDTRIGTLATKPPSRRQPL